MFLDRRKQSSYCCCQFHFRHTDVALSCLLFSFTGFCASFTQFPTPVLGLVTSADDCARSFVGVRLGTTRWVLPFIRQIIIDDENKRKSIALQLGP